MMAPHQGSHSPLGYPADDMAVTDGDPGLNKVPFEGPDFPIPPAGG
jgi:hypothetical protein